jgi:purine-binding chemotaxis protein CheW
MTQATVADDAFYVTIGIDREVFAVPVEMVLEILEMRPMFRIPEAPAHLTGLIDVRGRAVAVIDLRTKLGLPAVAADDDTKIVVLDVPIGERRLALGLVADRVFEVIALDDRQIEQPPDIGTRWHSDYIRGIGRRLDSFVVVLDLVRLFCDDAAALMAVKSKALDGGAPANSKAA